MRTCHDDFVEDAEGSVREGLASALSVSLSDKTVSMAGSPRPRINARREAMIRTWQ